MDTWIWILIAVVAVAVVIAIVAWTVARNRRRSEELRGQFGSEYDRTVERTDSRRDAEAELAARRERRARLDIRPLTPQARDRYGAAWAEVQGRFVDRPAESLRDADALVIALMRERGYPMDDFDQRAADVSVDHPDVVEHYRAAHDISANSERNNATTEDMRQGLVHYRALFQDLLETDPQDRSRRAV